MSNTRRHLAARAPHRLARKYLGVDGYPTHQPGEKRIKVRVRSQRMLMQPAADATEGVSTR